MALIPVENVGETGIVKDINPWQLPPNVWSDGNNDATGYGHGGAGGYINNAGGSGAGGLIWVEEYK